MVWVFILVSLRRLLAGGPCGYFRFYLHCFLRWWEGVRMIWGFDFNCSNIVPMPVSFRLQFSDCLGAWSMDSCVLTWIYNLSLVGTCLSKIIWRCVSMNLPFYSIVVLLGLRTRYADVTSTSAGTVWGRYAWDGAPYIYIARSDLDLVATHAYRLDWSLSLVLAR